MWFAQELNTSLAFSLDPLGCLLCTRQRKSPPCAQRMPMHRPYWLRACLPPADLCLVDWLVHPCPQGLLTQGLVLGSKEGKVLRSLREGSRGT